MSVCLDNLICQKICRTCLVTLDDMTSTLETKSFHNLSFKHIIMSIANVQISEKDGLTGFVCGKCTMDAESAYDFKIRCETSDALLRTKAENMGLAVSWPIAKLEKEEEIKYSVVKEEMLDIKYDPSTSAVFKNDPSSDGANDYDPIDDLCLDERLEDEEEQYLNKSASDKSKRLTSKKLNRSTCNKSNKDEDVQPQSTADFSKCVSKYRTENKKITYTCHLCKAIFCSAHIHRKHMKKIHEIVFVPSTADPLPADSAQDAKSDDGSEYKCSECEFGTETFTLLKSHMIIHTGDKPIFCDECDYRCVDVRSLVEHKRKHTGEKPYACPKCTYRSASRSSLRLHNATHSTERPYPCQQCPFAAKLITSLHRHVARRHKKEKNHVCPICDKRFFSITYFKVHMRIHSGEKPHICDVCGLAFAQKSNLRLHADRAHAPDTAVARKYACDICPYRAAALDTLRKHKLKHTGQKPAVCNLCDFRCTTSSAMRLHKQRHIGDARFACDTCPYKCYTNDRLRVHKRRHTGERPFPCTKCDFRFSTKAGLCKHMVSHDNEQAFACPNCPYTSNYKRNLVKHQKSRCEKTRKYGGTKMKAGRKSTTRVKMSENPTDNKDRTVDSISEDN